MNNKDFVQTMATRLDMRKQEVQNLCTSLPAAMAEVMEEGDTLPLQGFGIFEIRKKLERIVINPVTKQRLLVPPRLAVAFKPSSALKEKTKATEV